jgi:hypothetical protein
VRGDAGFQSTFEDLPDGGDQNGDEVGTVLSRVRVHEPQRDEEPIEAGREELLASRQERVVVGDVVAHPQVDDLPIPLLEAVPFEQAPGIREQERESDGREGVVAVDGIGELPLIHGDDGVRDPDQITCAVEVMDACHLREHVWREHGQDDEVRVHDGKEPFEEQVLLIVRGEPVPGAEDLERSIALRTQDSELLPPHVAKIDAPPKRKAAAEREGSVRLSQPLRRPLVIVRADRVGRAGDELSFDLVGERADSSCTSTASRIGLDHRDRPDLGPLGRGKEVDIQ